MTPRIRPRTRWRVAEVQALADYRLAIRFLDGMEGVVDLSRLVRAADAGVFAALADPSLFAQVFVLHGAPTWPGGLDLAPDAIYAAIKEKGVCIIPSSAADGPSTSAA